MSFKSLLQIIVICLIFTIIGTVYLLYFNENRDLVEQQSKDLAPENEKEIINNINNQIDVVIEEKKEKPTTNESDIEQNESDIEQNESDIEQNESGIEQEDENKKIDQIKDLDKENILNEIEYIGTDKKGNKYKIFAKSGKTNKDDRSLLDLTEVRGIVSSNRRPNIYIVSDFAIYNSSNLNSNFYQNVIINYEEKQIDCDFFDLNMKTNFATAYGNVIVTDPTSIMKAGKINLNLSTKDVEITPEDQNKVKVLTN